MIIVPTAALLGILTDVLPLADDSKDSPLFGVLLEWTGTVLNAHASYAGGLMAGASTWDPDDTFDAPPDDAGYVPGPTREDEPAWRVFVSYPDAVEIVKTFKVPEKFRHVPLFVKVNDTGTRLIVERSRDTGRTEHVMTVQPTGTEAAFPDIARTAWRFRHGDSDVGRVEVWGHRLAAFSNASRRGPLELAFNKGGPIVVQVGDRFIGMLTPERAKSEASSVLRDGAGVLV